MNPNEFLGIDLEMVLWAGLLILAEIYGMEAGSGKSDWTILLVMIYHELS
jgi:hypothetical protein